MYLEFEKTGKMTITGDLFKKLQDLCLTYRSDSYCKAPLFYYKISIVISLELRTKTCSQLFVNTKLISITFWILTVQLLTTVSKICQKTEPKLGFYAQVIYLL